MRSLSTSSLSVLISPHSPISQAYLGQVQAQVKCLWGQYNEMYRQVGKTKKVWSQYIIYQKGP